MPGRRVRFSAKYRSNFIHAFKYPDHDLLVELRALCEEGFTIEVVEGENIGSALGSRGNNLGSCDFGETIPVQMSAKGSHKGRRKGEGGLSIGVPQAEGRVVQKSIQADVEYGLVDGEGDCFGDRRYDRNDRLMDLVAAGCILLGNNQSLNLQNALVLDGGQRIELVLFHYDLGDAAGVAQEEEAKFTQTSEVVHPAGDQDFLSDTRAEVCNKNAFHVYLKNPSPMRSE